MDAIERLSSALADRYRIERELGQGGMATVYLAEDLKHKRKVAVKVLRPELAAVLGADRFVQEITTTAALQHPHILPLFDSGSAEGFLYYVMPFIDGETLRSKLDRETQLGIDEAVKITTAIADALDYAHRHGVIHRDIKPENILLHDGRPMVADFGIALAVSAAAGGRMTETGMSLGTPHYMSPEQATAEKEITARSDVYSLGSVLYEMLTGQPPHIGGSAQQIIMKIITDDAQPVTKLRKAVPAHVAAAVAKSLEKLPADRFASAAEFAAALGDTGYGIRETEARARASGTARPPYRLTALLGAVAVLLAIALVWSVTRPAPPRPVTRYRVELPQGQELSGTPWSRVAVSPDGSRLVYVGNSERSTQLFVRTRDQLDAVALPGTEGAINPSFSPDGSRVAFMVRTGNIEVRTVALAGGSSLTVSDSAVGAPGVAWGPDGYIYYDMNGVGPLMRVREGGGGAESIGQLDSARGELQHAWPDILPNGRGAIMTMSHGGPGSMGSAADEIGVLDLKTGRHHVLLRGIFARYARSGHLVYITADGSLMSVPFDQDKMELTGDPVSLAEGVGVRTGSGSVDLAISATGTLWYAAGGVGASGTFQTVWVGRDGVATPVAADLIGIVGDPALSPDGRRLAVTMRGMQTQVWIKDLVQGTLSKLTVAGRSSLRPAWTPDGRSVAFVADRATATRDVFQRLADGSRPEALLLDAPGAVDEVTLSSDGLWIVYRAERDLYARRLGTDSSITLVATPADEAEPALSPDGRWLAYVSTESGTNEVYVRPFPNTADGRWQISAGGGQEPVWARSGRELFYRTAGTAADSQMVMQVTTGRAFVSGVRRALFALTRIEVSPSHQQYDVTPDGRRFVMTRGNEALRRDHLIVVENFFEVLRSRMARR